MLKKVKFYLMTLSMPTLAAFAIFGDGWMAEASMNVVTFGCWAMAVISTLCVVFVLAKDASEPGHLKKINEKFWAEKVTPVWIDHLADAVAVVLLAAAGKFLLASLWLYHWGITYVMTKRPE